MVNSRSPATTKTPTTQFLFVMIYSLRNNLGGRPASAFLRRVPKASSFRLLQGQPGPRPYRQPSRSLPAIWLSAAARATRDFHRASANRREQHLERENRVSGERGTAHVPSGA